jgi:hypothetical protein
MENRWINTKAFKDEFGIAVSTQAKMRKEKVLPYSKISSFIFYDRNLIDKLFENHCKNNGGQS